MVCLRDIILQQFTYQINYAVDSQYKINYVYKITANYNEIATFLFYVLFAILYCNLRITSTMISVFDTKLIMQIK